MRKGVDILIGIRELKGYLRIGQTTLHRLVTEEDFPVYRVAQGNGGRMLWISSKSLVSEWLRTKIQQAKTQA
jgi:predicted DNA-binding transcriptional regulator AlpA